MQTETPNRLATDLMARRGGLQRIEFLARGATSAVWRLQSGRGRFVLRIFESNAAGRVLRGDLDAFLRREVIARGGRVATLLECSENSELQVNGKSWCLEVLAAGDHPARGALPEPVCRQLGETLAVLHQVPVRHFGRPSRITDHCLIGARSDAREGVMQRFELPLAELLSGQAENAVLRALPELAADILRDLQEVSDVVAAGNVVLCHTDLHEKQLICADNRLSALIDFADATIMDRHWDLGSAYYFHGAENFAPLLEAYTGLSGKGVVDAGLVPKFSIAIAMHHVSRSRLPGKQHRFERAVGHLRRVFPH